MTDDTDGWWQACWFCFWYSMVGILVSLSSGVDCKASSVRAVTLVTKLTQRSVRILWAPAVGASFQIRCCLNRWHSVSRWLVPVQISSDQW